MGCSGWRKQTKFAALSLAVFASAQWCALSPRPAIAASADAAKVNPTPPAPLASAAAPEALPFIHEPPPLATDTDVIDPANTLELAGLQQNFEDIAKKVSGSVVAVSAAQGFPTGDDASRHGDNSDAAMEGSAFRSAEMNPEKLQDILDESTRTVGAGFVIDPDGYILTNEHVVDQAQELWVTTADHKVWPAIIVGSDPRADLAVLKVPAKNLSPVQFAPDVHYQRGQWTIALGNPYGLGTDGEPSMSVGVVAAVDRSLPRLAVKEDRLYSRLIQTTAEINPGNSGGPLFGIDGRVIGINTAVILPQKQINGIGFAIPVTSRLVSEVRDLEQGREIVYAYLGVSVGEATAEQRAQAGTAADVGVRIDVTEPDSPAAITGIKPGDLVIRLNGQTIYGADQFIRLVGESPVARPMQITLVRDKKTITASAVPVRRPVSLAAVTRDTQRLHWRGMWLGPIPDAEHDSSAKFAGLLVHAVDDNCPLKDQGVVEGSIITTVAGQSVNSLVDLLNVINETSADHCIVQLAGPATRPVK